MVGGTAGLLDFDGGGVVTGGFGLTDFDGGTGVLLVACFEREGDGLGGGVV